MSMSSFSRALRTVSALPRALESSLVFAMYMFAALTITVIVACEERAV